MNQGVFTRRLPVMRFTHQPGSKPLAGYTIQRGIHRGGFGEVYYAQSDGGKEVALKLVQHEQEVELRGVQQCLNLKHPNLVNLFDVKKDATGEQWVVMEYVNGTSLEDVLAACPSGLPIDEVRDWIDGIIAGVAYLHDRGIVHRDLKPGNVYRENGIVKVGDVGLSKRLGSDRRGTHTQSVGTVYYMAPEVARGQYGPEVDVYSLGVMLYELLTGQVPFMGETSAEVLMKHLTSPPNLLPIPPAIRPVVAHALEKDPQQRTPTVLELQREFDIAVTSMQTSAPVGVVNGHHNNGRTGFANGVAFTTVGETVVASDAATPIGTPRRVTTRTAAQAASAYAQYPPAESPEATATEVPRSGPLSEPDIEFELARSKDCRIFVRLAKCEKGWSTSVEMEDANGPVSAAHWVEYRPSKDEALAARIEQLIEQWEAFRGEGAKLIVKQLKQYRGALGMNSRGHGRRSKPFARPMGEKVGRFKNSQRLPLMLAALVVLWMFYPGTLKSWTGLAILGGAFALGSRLRTAPADEATAFHTSFLRPNEAKPVPPALSLGDTVEEIATSLALGSISASLLSVGAMLCMEFVSRTARHPTADLMAMFTATSIIATSIVLLTGRLLRKGSWFEKNPRKTFLVAGILVGTAAYFLNQFLLVIFSNQAFGFGYSPAYRSLGVHPLTEHEMNPTWLGYVVFFAGLMFLRRWWVDMEPKRQHRLGVGRLITAAIAAWLMTTMFSFPQWPAILWAATISAAVQLATEWSPRQSRILYGRI